MNDQTLYDSISADWTYSKKEILKADQVQYFDSIGSTNDVLLEQARNETNTTIIPRLAVADFQTSGRGRRGDAWLAPTEKNLLFSVLLPLNIEKKYWTRIPQLIAWTMGRTIESTIDPELRIEAKWPNDLYLAGKKLGGILVETSMNQNAAAIVGVGLNVNIKSNEFPPELSSIATSLYEHVGCESNRWYLLGQYLAILLNDFPSKVIEFEDCLSWIRERDYLRNRKIDIKQSGRKSHSKAIARGIGDEGQLLVETENGKMESIFSADQLVVC